MSGCLPLTYTASANYSGQQDGARWSLLARPGGGEHVTMVTKLGNDTFGTAPSRSITTACKSTGLDSAWRPVRAWLIRVEAVGGSVNRL